MRNFYFLQIPLGTDAAYLPQAVGTIWSYCNQFEEVRNRPTYIIDEKLL